MRHRTRRAAALGLAAGLSLAACSRCGPPPPPPDAGLHRRAMTDLSSALLATYPENRGARVRLAFAEVVREYVSLPADVEVLGRQKHGWKDREDGGAGWHVASFLVQRRGPTTLAISIPLDDDRVGRLYEAPLGMSAAEVGYYLPAAGVAKETFSFELRYVTHPARAAWMVRQLSDMLTANGRWTAPLPPDWLTGLPADGGSWVPDPLDLTFTESDTGATVRVQRVAGSVTNRYELVTDELLP